jgi:branched-subunit amino acid aminotransferase/4-amino-4-deoxychorismate lyase
MTSYCYINGKIDQLKLGSLPVTDLGLQRGFGVFDYVRTYQGKLFHFEDHLDRLHSSANALNLEISLSNLELREIAEDLIRRSSLSNPAVRIILTGGEVSAPQILKNPNLILIAEELPLWPKNLYSQGVKLITVEFQRELPHIKSINYLNALRLEPVKQQKNAFDMLYTHLGEITECPRNNFFVFIDDVLVTPRDNILLGITRKVVLQAGKEKYEVEERRLKISELGRCQEAFISSTSKEIMPVTQIDHHKIGSGKVGERTKRMMKHFRDYVRSYLDNHNYKPALAEEA